jgi:hypothetical protein
MELKWVSDGVDSTVYRMNTEYIVKVYDRMLTLLEGNTDKCLQLLNQYADDTLKTSEIVNAEWAKLYSYQREFFFNSKEYDTKIVIIPQGKTELISLPTVNVPPRIEPINGKYVASVGQKYIIGANLCEVISGYDTGEVDSIFHASINTFESSMKKSLNYLSRILSHNVNIPFTIGRANVVPSLNESNNYLELIITDLASDILGVYK